jgi:hypothetical protein
MRVAIFSTVHHVSVILIYKLIVNVRMPHTFAEVRLGCRRTSSEAFKAGRMPKPANARNGTPDAAFGEPSYKRSSIAVRGRSSENA